MESSDLVFLATTRMPVCRQRLDKRVVGYYTMQFLEDSADSSVDVAYDDHWTRMENNAWFWPAYPGPRLRFQPAPGCDSWFHRHVGFQGPLVQRWIQAGLWPTEAQPAPPLRDWPAHFDELIVCAKRADHWGRLRAINLLEQILILLAEARAQPPAPARLPWLETVLEALEAEGVFAPDYESLARKTGMGMSTLRRRFKETTGGSLHAYVLQARMARARALLAETELPLKQVAERLGYHNVYFFARQFKQQVGAAPGVYRRSRPL